MKRVKFSKEALLSLDAILREMGITLHKDSNTNDEIDGTIIGYDGKAISIEEAISLFNLLYSNEVRLIDANALHAKICEDVGNNYGASLNIAQVLLYIETAPTIEFESGQWIPTVIKGLYKCSACNFEQTSNPNQRFCSYCGAKMSGGTEDVRAD